MSRHIEIGWDRKDTTRGRGGKASADRSEVGPRRKHSDKAQQFMCPSPKVIWTLLLSHDELLKKMLIQKVVASMVAD